MRFSRTLALGATTLVLAVSACSSGGGSSKPTVKVGSVGFDEARSWPRPTPRSSRTRLHGQPRRHRPRRPQGAPARPGERPDRPQAGVHRLGARVELRRHADRRPGREPDGAPDDPQRQGRRHHGPRLHAGAGPERVRRPQGDGRPVLAHQDERPGRGAGQAQARPRHRLPDEPAVRRGPQGRVRHRHDERHAARGVRHADGPGARSPRPSTSASSARRSPTSS